MYIGIPTLAVDGSLLVGGFIGNNVSSIVINSYWDINTSGQSDSAGGIGLPTEQMQLQSTFEPEWNFETIWNINEEESYPFLQWQGGPI